MYAEAKRYLDVQDYAQALPALQKAAEAGSADAMYQLGELYYYGNGVNQDYAKALGWYEKATAAGNADAMYSLGDLYENGRGVTQDYARARRWYQKAADAGDNYAKWRLQQKDPSSPAILWGSVLRKSEALWIRRKEGKDIVLFPIDTHPLPSSPNESVKGGKS